ncbi:MAG TPA: ABC transporter substrate-binding protein [Acetobacteraceae bacterium]|nr:ABC transporter substrate-binding protein [Acetobacteraceae bacterium]
MNSVSRRTVMGVILAAPMIARGAAAQSVGGLTVTWGEDDVAPRTYDPRVTSSRHEYQVIAQVFDPLIASDGSNKLFPGLATAWDVAPDGKSVTLKLRSDVSFHDGTPFDAEAVKFTFDTIADPKTASEAAITQLGPYAGCEVIDPHTVRVTYSQPFGAALASYAEGTLAPVSPTTVKRLGNQGFARAPVGTGPFRFVSWEEGRQVILERFDQYNWAPSYNAHTGPSAVQRVVHRFIGDASTRVAALEAGEIDISDATPILDMKRFGETRGYATMIGNAAGIPFGLELNGSRGIFSDVRVRRALAMAVDRKTLSDNLFFGLVDPAYGPLSKGTPGYWAGAEAIYRPDPKGAIALLEEAGWKPGPGGVRVKDGLPLSGFYGAPPPLEPDTAVEIQAVARRVGFDLKVETITFARNQQLVFDNAFDMLPVRWIQADPTCLENLFSSSNIPSAGHYRYNWMQLRDAKLDALFAEGRAVTDPAKRAAVYAEAQKIIMDGALWFPVHNQVQTLAYRTDKQGYHFARASWIALFYDVTKA